MSERVMEDDIDIYGDLDNIKDGEKIDPALVKELNEKNAVLEGKVEELSNDLDKLRKYCGSLEANISSLHKTARVEIERKDRMISELRQQIDNAAFRRDNFRIPKRINKPVKFPPPPKEDSYYPETVKKEVNGTINREETTYASPLNDEADDTEQIYQPEKVPVTLFGERLRKRLQREAEEEAEAAKVLEEQNEASEPKKSAEDVDKENQYRLIPLDLKDSENSRRRGSENSEQEEPKLPETSDRRRQKENHDDYPNHDKRRKFGDNESRRGKSPVDRHKNSRRSEERRKLEHEEYSCPSKGVNDEISAKRRHRDNETNRITSSGRKSRNNGSDSRSKSRERRERREDSRDSHAERRKNGRTSRSPKRRHENGKLGKRDRKIMEERVERTREKLRSSKRLRGRDASPSGSKLDLRQRLGKKSESIVQRRINTRSELRNSRETRRSERREKIGEGAKDKGKGRSSSEKGKDEKREGRDREKRKRSRSCSSEKNERESKKVNGDVDVHEDTMDALDCLEEGEIRDSPGAPLIFIPGYRSDDDKPGGISHVKTGVHKLGVIIDKNCLDDTLDDSIKEEKIENIEKFIMKMQEKDEETEVNRIEVNLKEVSSTVDEKIEALDGETKTIMINNEAVPYNSVLSKYVKKKRESTEKILEREEINESSSVIEKIESINSVDKTDVCASVKNDAPKIADNNVTKNNINTGNKIDNGDSKEKTEIISAAEKCNLDEIDDKIVGINSEEKTSNSENDSLKCLTKEEIEENNDELKINSGEVNQNGVESDRAKENGDVDEKEEELQSNDAKLEEKPKLPKEEIIEASKIPSKSSGAPSRMILQQIASPTKTQSKQVDNPLQKLEPKEKENSVKSSTALPNRIVVVARRRKVRLTDSSTSMTVVMSAKKTPVP